MKVPQIFLFLTGSFFMWNCESVSVSGELFLPTHLAYGPNRRQRNFVSKKEITDQIQIWTTLGKAPFEERTGNFHWEMVVAIPNTILVYTPNFTFSNKSARANFYKCGDHTSKPHYF